jgi:hypothetical protein
VRERLIRLLLISALVAAKVAPLAKRPRSAIPATAVKDLIFVKYAPRKLFERTFQVLRTRKTIKAMTRMVPSMPPPMYMGFPFDW